MATYTITTSNAEEKALTHMVAKRNAARAAEVPPKDPLTNEQYLDNILVRRSLLAFKEEMDRDEQKQIADAYASASNQTQSDIKTTLGL